VCNYFSNKKWCARVREPSVTMGVGDDYFALGSSVMGCFMLTLTGLRNAGLCASFMIGIEDTSSLYGIT
jgi:hypothetical protein